MNNMKKRGMALFLILCTLVSTVALAEERPPLRIAGSFNEGYWKEHRIPINIPNYHWAQGLALMQRENAPDLYAFPTYGVDFYTMKDTGILEDLSKSEVIRQAVSQMRPEIQELVTNKDGEIVALPTGGWIQPLYWRQDAWDAAGLTAGDVPQSYTELLDFCEKWAERVEKHKEKEVCLTTFQFSSDTYINWLLTILVNTWEMQQHYAGETLNFDTPEFIALLERTKKVGKLLKKAEPSQKKCKNMMILFRAQEGSSVDGLFNGGRDYGLSHSIPFRITRDQPALMRSFTGLQVLRKGSVWTQEAIRYLEEAAPKQKGFLALEIYPNSTAPGDYGYDGFADILTEGWIKDREAYTGIISFAPMRTYEQYEGALGKFITGELSAEKLAAKISVPKDDPNK